ncbi:putative peptide transporter permease subunit: membrane component of ABC superfamily [Bradyrhizobium sp. ORS 375]|uniref:ABC transporter permease n=1 Tax=Bradyrhizobium sp. (strain ORS 375) TaxID=566679 RepID=UPI00024095D8|nr:ABC transporter permease [Bradyrhizobium sp. ORS 375]CCD90455.1 putative peptide transporter permease subunit: membrane component of ABC superfamily [Bradyrhizobium sp. ORS 375]
MLHYCLKRLATAFLVALFVSILSFFLIRMSGDVAIALAGEGARLEDIEAVRTSHGLDRPLIVQYLDWLGRAATGDFGNSLYFKSPVMELIADKIGNTVILSLAALLFALALGIPLGVLSAVYQGGLIDRLALGIAVVGQALPNFFFALILVMFFAVSLRWVPVSGSETWLHFVLPSIVLGYYITPPFMRIVRAGMVDALEMDFVRTARAKGLSKAKVVLKHALANALVPVVALSGVQLGHLLGGSIVIETIFALDGLGYLAYQSITHKDFPVTQVILLLLAITYVLLTLIADLINAWIDPRIRVS